MAWNLKFQDWHYSLNKSKIIKGLTTNAHRTTEHIHCGIEPRLEVVRFLAPREPWFSKQVLCLRKIGSYSVTALVMAKV